jgi:hypothetical protein
MCPANGGQHARYFMRTRQRWFLVFIVGLSTGQGFSPVFAHPLDTNPVVLEIVARIRTYYESKAVELKKRPEPKTYLPAGIGQWSEAMADGGPNIGGSESRMHAISLFVDTEPATFFSTFYPEEVHRELLQAYSGVGPFQVRPLENKWMGAIGFLAAFQAPRTNVRVDSLTTLLELVLRALSSSLRILALNQIYEGLEKSSSGNGKQFISFLKHKPEMAARLEVLEFLDWQGPSEREALVAIMRLSSTSPRTEIESTLDAIAQADVARHERGLNLLFGNVGVGRYLELLLEEPAPNTGQHVWALEHVIDHMTPVRREDLPTLKRIGSLVQTPFFSDLEPKVLEAIFRVSESYPACRYTECRDEREVFLTRLQKSAATNDLGCASYLAASGLDKNLTILRRLALAPKKEVKP